MCKNFRNYYAVNFVVSVDKRLNTPRLVELIGGTLILFSFLLKISRNQISGLCNWISFENSKSATVSYRGLLREKAGNKEKLRIKGKKGKRERTVNVKAEGRLVSRGARVFKAARRLRP